MNLYYEITENGYYIKDKDDSLFSVHQYEPFIPNRNDINDKNYEKYAQMQMNEILEQRKNVISIKDLQNELELTKQAIDELMMVTMEGGMI